MIVTIFYDALNPTGETTAGVTDLCAFLETKFKLFPEHAKIYLDHVAAACEVTPQCDADIQRLQALDGHFFVVVYPGGPIIIGVIIAVVLAAAAIALTFLYRPNSAKQQNQGSPNNALADRQNQARPNERIPDIVGTVRAVPDLLCPPYRFFNQNQEIEDCFLCIGRKSFEFYQTTHDATGVLLPKPLWDIKDDLTPIQEEAGASVEVWAPYTSPNPYNTSGVQTYTPQLRIGAPINSPAYIVNASTAVVGQILRPPNDQSLNANNTNMYAQSDGTLHIAGDNQNNIAADFTQYYAIGDVVTVVFTNASDPGNIRPQIDLSGSYEVLAVDAAVLTLSNPQAVNSAWTALASFSGGVTKNQNAQTTSTNSKWVGPYVVNVAQVSQIWCNYVAPQGLYKVNSSSGVQYRTDITVQIGIQAINAYQQPIGAEVFYTGVCSGSATQQSQRAVTIRCTLPAIGPCQVRSLRISPTDTTWQGTNVDQIQWRDLYAVTVPTDDNYGNVTCIQTRTLATASALTAKSRKLNMLVTAQILTAASPTTPVPSDNAGDIICALAFDPFIGNRSLAEVDVTGIRNVFAASAGVLSSYFGTDLGGRFGYTFDDSNTSFEEMLSDIQQATFCTLFRRGSQLQCAPELLATSGTVLFNHRNKLPGTETRTTTFGWTNNYDGIELTYIEPNAPNFPNVDTPLTLYFPAGQSALNPKKITAVGVRNNVQAHLLGSRLFNKLQYQNEQVEFTTVKSAALCITNERIIVADNTRDNVMDGYVVGIYGLTLTLSQPVMLDPTKSYTIFLQDPAATIDAIQVSQPAGLQPNEVLLQNAPASALSTDLNNWAQTSYLIAIPADDADLPAAMMLTEKTWADKQQYTIKAINYDRRYYSNDKDFINGVVVANSPITAGGTGYPSPTGSGDPGDPGDPGNPPSDPPPSPETS